MGGVLVLLVLLRCSCATGRGVQVSDSPHVGAPHAPAMSIQKTVPAVKGHKEISTRAGTVLTIGGWGCKVDDKKQMP